jgi:hypothetical protein
VTRRRRRRVGWGRRVLAVLAVAGAVNWAWRSHPVALTICLALAALAPVAVWWGRRAWLRREGQRTVLYRHYMQAGRPIYYGITSRYDLRCGQHAEGSWWWPLVDPALSTCQEFPNRRAAELAEARAIAADCPPGNTQYNRQWKQQLELRLWLMGVAAQMRGPVNPNTPIGAPR